MTHLVLVVAHYRGRVKLATGAPCAADLLQTLHQCVSDRCVAQVDHFKLGIASGPGRVSTARCLGASGGH